MLVLRVFRTDKVVEAVQRYVADLLGPQFIQPPSFDMGAAYADSDQCSPLLFVLSQGVDPSKDIFKFAETKGFGNLENISLGQGQGPIAEQAIREVPLGCRTRASSLDAHPGSGSQAIDKGSWVLLQNCHVAVSWLPTLERIVDELRPETTNPAFRLWLTSMPSDQFPVSILQNGIKMTNEPPKGLKANLLQTYRAMDAKEFDEKLGSRPDTLRKLIYGLSFFHALVLERRKFGPLGWNIRYEFTESDMRISKQQLQLFLEMFPTEVPFKALRFLVRARLAVWLVADAHANAPRPPRAQVGQLNYGGRVTDDWDRRTLSNLLDTFLCPAVLEDGYTFHNAAYGTLPNGSLHKDYLKLVGDLPINDDPAVRSASLPHTRASAPPDSRLRCRPLVCTRTRASPAPSPRATCCWAASSHCSPRRAAAAPATAARPTLQRVRRQLPPFCRVTLTWWPPRPSIPWTTRTA